MSTVAQPPLTEHKWPLLDLLRIGAALLVVLGHTRFLYFASPIKLAQSSIGLQAFYFLTSLSHQAVVFFFVISGFLVGGPILIRAREHSFDAWTYLINRFSRIYIVFIPALLLAAMLSWGGSIVFAGTSAHTDLLDGWSDFNLLCHLSCLQGIVCASHADPPLWSLGYEWLLYLAAPLYFCTIFSSHKWVLRAIGLALLSILLFVILPKNTEWSLLLAWFAGAAIYQRLAYSSFSLSIGAVGILLIAIGCIASRHQAIPLFITDVVIAAGLALVVGCRKLMGFDRFAIIGATLAGFSYSLYAIHLPLVVISARALEWIGAVDAQPQLSLRYGAAYITSVVFALLAAFSFAAVTEANTDALRKTLLKHSASTRAAFSRAKRSSDASV